MHGGHQRKRISLTLGDALHELYIRLRSTWAGEVALPVEEVQICSTSHTHVSPHTHLTAHSAF